MRYPPIDKQFFISNRERFIKQLKPNSIAVFNANDLMPTNADGTMPFRQNSDLFYLTGVEQEDSILVIFPDAYLSAFKEVLFLRETNEDIAIWEGEKLTKEQASGVSGIKTVYWLNQFEAMFTKMMFEAKHVYLNTNEHARASVQVETKDARFIKKLKEKYPVHQYERSAPVMHALRAIKTGTEIELIKTACGITKKAFRKILQFVKPGVMEYEIEAEITGEFLRNRSRGHAYAPIIASGASACVLHYIDNDKICNDGDLILMDFGAEYANYASDLTRCIPVNGRFTKRQRAVYDAVLRVMREAIKMLCPGVYLDDYKVPQDNRDGILYHKEVGKIMESELIGLGLLDKTDLKKQDPNTPLYKKYFMHGTSHYLGLDVHDLGFWNRPIQAGMVFTCEPGIYIREEKLGIRLENDFLITAQQPINLMESIPIEAEEIEDLMNRK